MNGTQDSKMNELERYQVTIMYKEGKNKKNMKEAEQWEVKGLIGIEVKEERRGS